MSIDPYRTQAADHSANALRKLASALERVSPWKIEIDASELVLRHRPRVVRAMVGLGVALVSGGFAWLAWSLRTIAPELGSMRLAAGSAVFTSLAAGACIVALFAARPAPVHIRRRVGPSRDGDAGRARAMPADADRGCTVLLERDAPGRMGITGSARVTVTTASGASREVIYIDAAGPWPLTRVKAFALGLAAWLDAGFVERSSLTTRQKLRETDAAAGLSVSEVQPAGAPGVLEQMLETTVSALEVGAQLIEVLTLL